MFYYTDISDTLDNSILLVKAVFSGNFTDFYSFSILNAHANTVYAANYDIPIYLIFAVWNLPVIIAHFLWDLDYMNCTWALIWCKSIVLPFLFGISFFMKKIDSLFHENNQSLPVSYTILLFTSSTVFLSSFIALQYDCISLLLIMAGLYFYLKEDYKRFLLLFYAAIPLKLFAVFLLLPLILLKEKNIPKAGIQFISGFVVPFLLKWFYHGDAAYHALTSAQNRDAGNLITGSNFTVGSIQINLFIAIYMSICVICYLHKKSSDFKQWCIFICSCVFAAFTLFLPIRSYWIILAEPFLLLLIGIHRKNFTLNLLIHTGSSFACLLYFIYNHWIYSYDGIVTKLLLGKFFTLPEYPMYGSVKSLLDTLPVADYLPLLRTVFITGVLLLLWLNRPQSISTDLPDNNWKFLFPLRITFLAGICALFVYAAFKSDTAPCFSTLESYDSQEESYAPVNLSDGASISQYFSLEYPHEVTRLRFICQNTPDRSNRGSIMITLTNTETGEVFVQEQVYCALIQNKEPYTVEFPKVYLPSGDYSIHFQGITTRRSMPVYIASTSAETENTVFTISDGIICDYNLCVQLQ